MRRITPALAAVGAALLVGVAGCTSQTSADETVGTVQTVQKASAAIQVLQASARKAAEVTSYRADLAVKLTGTQEGSGTVQGTVAFQQRPELITDLSLDKVNFDGLEVPGGLRMIMQDRTMYLRMDLLKTLLGVTKPWVRIDLDKAGEQSGVDVDQLLDQARRVDLQTSVKMLTSSADARAVGTETVGGVETTRYTGTFKAEDAVRLFEPEMQEKVRQNLYAAESMTFDIWVDQENLPRKLTMTGDADGGKVDVTMTFSDFNEPVKVKIPPASQVGELPRTGAGRGQGD